MDLTLRPMSTSQILDRTFHLYRNNFMLFAGIAVLPPALVLLAQSGVAALELLPGEFAGAVTSTVLIGAGIVVLVVLYLAGVSLATGATVHAVSRVHLGNPVTIVESYRTIRPYVWRIARIVAAVFIRSAGALLVAALVIVLPITVFSTVGAIWLDQTGEIGKWVVGLVVVAGFTVCLIWSIRLYCSYQLAVPACVLEKLGAVACLKRSRSLTKGKSVQRVLLINFLVAVLTYVLSQAFSVPAILAMPISARTRTLSILFVGLQYLASFFASTLAGPIATIAIVLVYYDERVRKEALDLQLMMEALGQAATAQANPTEPAQQPAAGTPPPLIG